MNRVKNKKIEESIVGLMRSYSYKDWFRAWEIIRVNLPEEIKDFDGLDSYFNLREKQLFMGDMVYDLEQSLHNDGFDDLNMFAKRAELSRWVYMKLTEESELNLCNFRSFEAESLWEMGKIDEAKKCFMALMEAYPEFVYCYIHYGDCYWTSDWSYQFGPDYDAAERIYRMALEKPNIFDLDVVKDRLKDLKEERNVPKSREKIRKYRLRRIQKRKKLETSMEAESPEDMEMIIGYSAFRTWDECYEYNENACFIADTPKSLEKFIEGAGFSMGDYRIDPVKLSDITVDYGCSSGEYAMELEALKRFEGTVDQPYSKEPFDDPFISEPDLYVVTLGQANPSNTPGEENKSLQDIDFPESAPLSSETKSVFPDKMGEKSRKKKARKKKAKKMKAKKTKRMKAKTSKRKTRP